MLQPGAKVSVGSVTVWKEYNASVQTQLFCPVYKNLGSATALASVLYYGEHRHLFQNEKVLVASALGKVVMAEVLVAQNHDVCVMGLEKMTQN